MVFIADLHALTTRQVPAEGSLQERSLELAALLLAGGVQPERCVLFTQSAVPRHAELCWLLACLATHARLAQLPHYREKSAATREVPVGLLLYPVLQAADVLVYRGTHVPVGADQLQHLQVAAQLVKTFHHRYGPTFPTPRALLPDDGSDRVRSLRDPTKKMSKSDPDPKSRILLTDSDDDINLKIRKAVTDCDAQVTYDPTRRPGVSNLVRLHCLAAGLLHEEAVLEAQGLTTAQYKSVVASALSSALAPLRARASDLRARPRLLRDVLRHGAARARRRADAVYADVSNALALVDAPAVHQHPAAAQRRPS
ncbi:tryptophan--tRNA ligase, mitochondrial isoform X2 [Leptidea sinapis]|nr:tryptophan--tRNA ligase, mitochondrial isoform X2 [Leptidea sinapis]